MLSTNNKKVALFLIIVGIGYLILSFRLPSYPYVPVDSDLIPVTLGILLILLSIILYFTEDHQDKDKKLILKKRELQKLIGIFLLIVLYIFFLEIIGFVIVTALFIFTSSFLLGYRKHVTNIIVSILVPLAFYLLFTNLLQINLPQGILPF